MRERQKKKKGRTWAEAAKTVLEKYPNTPMSHKEILQVIQRERLKEISGTSPLACLNAMLHTNSRGAEGIFYKVPGRMGVYTLKDASEVATESSDEDSEESSDNLSDSRSSENNSGPREGRRRRWIRPVPSKLPSQQQPTSPQPRCSSPSVAAKLISPSQKHSKKALKQALKQQQQRNQRRQVAMPTTSSSRLLLKTIKDMADNLSAKTGGYLCLPIGSRRVSQRSGHLSAGHLKRNRCKIDVETPDSILVNTNLRALINKHTFSVLPLDCQQRLLQLLPEVDQQACTDGLLKVTSSALNNEFFTSAAQSWKERLAEGEFTPELQLRMRQEIEKEKKVEHWKETFFESYYGKNCGLSLEESKELTKADLKWEPRHRQPRMAARVSDDRSRSDGGAAKDAKSRLLQEKTLPPPKEPLIIPELMKTRRSQHATDRKLPAPTSKPQPGERSELIKPDAQVEPSEKKDQTELPPSLVKTDPLLDAGTKVQEDPPTSEVKSTGETKAEPEGPSKSQKRNPPSKTEDEATPEKIQRISSVSSVSSISSISPPASSEASPAKPDLVGNQRVPPLKIPVSRILSVPVSPSQVPLRTPLSASLSSPVRTGARTLADIKAKAQLARAQRAAAAAAFRSALSAGDPEPTKPSPSLTSPHSSASLPCNITGTPPTCPTDSVIPLSLNGLNPQDVRTVSVQSCRTGSASIPKSHEIPSGSNRTSFCIPANNPLVTRILQGKEVPLEQILPKPLAKGEAKVSDVHSSKRTVRGHEHNQCDTAHGGFSDDTRHQQEPLDQHPQDQILQTQMERKVQEKIPQQRDHQASCGEAHQDRPWISVGFFGRKRTPRPAMSGHYLLNVSTYGRGSECKRPHRSAIPNTDGLKREVPEGTVEFKIEQQSSSVSEYEQTGSLLTCPEIKTEPAFENSAINENPRGLKQFYNQGKLEPYLPPKDASHQQPCPFPTPRMSIHQESVSPRYGGTISVSLPHTLNRNTTVGAATVPDAGSVMSFSVTVTTIPEDRSTPPPEQSFIEATGMEDAQSKCYCRLKAMIMCKGCGAFCHDDCIGPSELCVSCLVVR
ncbi:putative Polycomb group protein ASXL2 isoform X2 [Stigmatopora argus]